MEILYLHICAVGCYNSTRNLFGMFICDADNCLNEDETRYQEWAALMSIVFEYYDYGISDIALC